MTLGFYVGFFLMWSYDAVIGFNTTKPTPRPTPYNHLRLITPKGVYPDKTFVQKHINK